jgi:hypothetical protein
MKPIKKFQVDFFSDFFLHLSSLEIIFQASSLSVLMMLKQKAVDEFFEKKKPEI